MAAVLIVAAALGGHARAADAPLGRSIDELLARAREVNPELAAMRAEAEAASERVQPAGALADPMLRMELMDITNRESGGSTSLLPNRVGSTKYTIAQMLPWWGKRDLKRAVAQAQANQARGRRDAALTELLARVKMTYAMYYANARSERIVGEIIGLATQMERIAQVRYASGLVPQQDVIRAQVELTAMQTELVMLDNERRQLRARMNALLLRPAGAPLAEPERLRALPHPAKLEAARLEERVKSGNPLLFAQEAQIDAAERNRELVLKERFPDVTVGVSPMQMGNRLERWEVMFEVNIPLQQQSRRSMERESERMLDAARARLAAAQAQLLSDLAEQMSGLDAALRLERLAADNLAPQSELTFTAALAGYETGKVDFATLLDAQRQIRKARLDALKAQAEQQVRLAEIERLIGEDL